MSNTAIKVENLSKIYRLGEIGTGSVGQDVDRWFKTKVLGKEDPFLKIGEANDRENKGKSDIVYSLRDINFEIEKGDAVGIIGRNGAGKSTLLKILSRVTTPTTGKINIKGRVASLLEVGTGFHPELTGRENIYLNGSILGMRKREIDRKLDEIIYFSGVERYIDTPVKRYSSGMYVRLAFAVAAHLESEILIVDEVLAVGDADFQKKCLGKMDQVSKGEGRTILFVSHNLAAINQFCKKSILLADGGLTDFDVTSKIIELYQTFNISQTNKNNITIKQNGQIKKAIYSNQKVTICLDIQIREKQKIGIEIVIKNLENSPILFYPSAFYNSANSKVLSEGLYYVENDITLPHLANGRYLCDIIISNPGIKILEYLESSIAIEVINDANLWNFIQETKQGYVTDECYTRFTEKNY